MKEAYIVRVVLLKIPVDKAAISIVSSTATYEDAKAARQMYLELIERMPVQQNEASA